MKLIAFLFVSFTLFLCPSCESSSNENLKESHKEKGFPKREQISADNSIKKNVTKSIVDFVPNGFLLQKEIYGDLNGDQKEDCVLILEKESGKEEPRAVRILLHSKKSKWVLFKTNWDLLGQEYANEYKINEQETYKIQNGKLILETYCYGPCGTTFLHFAFEKEVFVLSYYSYYFAGAGSHSFTEYSLKDEKVKREVTNTMLEEMPTEVEENEFKKRIPFESANREGNFEGY